MRKILTSSFLGYTEIEHTINIYDKEQSAGGTPVEFVLEAPGYILDYDAGITDVVQGGIIRSRVDIIARNKNKCLDWFLEQIKSQENRFILEILKDEEVNWRGVILQDFGSVRDLPNDAPVKISASDGLYLLKDIPITTTSLIEITETTYKTFLEEIINGLNEITSSELYTATDDFMKVKTDWYTDAIPQEVVIDEIGTIVDNSFFKSDILNWVGSAYPVRNNKYEYQPMWVEVKEKKGYDGTTIIEEKVWSYYEVIEHILQRFNAILLMQNGCWYITQRDLLTGNIEYYVYWKQKDVGLRLEKRATSTEPAVKVITPASQLYRVDGNFTYLPGLKNCKSLYAAARTGDSLLPRDFDVNTEITTFELESGEGNYLHFRMCFTDGWTHPDPRNDPGIYPKYYKAYPRIKITITCGSYYLYQYPQGDRRRAYWGLISTDRIYSGTAIYTFPNTPIVKNSNFDIEFLTEDLPEDAPVTVEVERLEKLMVPFRSTDENGNGPWWYDSYKYTTDPHGLIIPTGTYFAKKEETFLLYIRNNESPTAYIEFEQENDEKDDFFIEHDVKESIFGSSGHSARGLMWYWRMNMPTTPYDAKLLFQPSTQADRKWNKGKTSSKDYFFNELLCREMVANQSTMLLVFNGEIIDQRPTITAIEDAKSIIYPIQSIQLNYKESTYKLAPNKITYSAQTESWKGDWFEIDRKILLNIPRTEFDELVPGISNDMPLVPINPGTGRALIDREDKFSALDIIPSINDSADLLDFASWNLWIRNNTGIPRGQGGGAVLTASGGRIQIIDDRGNTTIIGVPPNTKQVIHGRIYNKKMPLNITEYDDWYLPSIEEIKTAKDYLNSNTYWSSTEINKDHASCYNPDTEAILSVNKNISLYVRPMRTFISSTFYPIGTEMEGGTICWIVAPGGSADIIYYIIAGNDVEVERVWGTMDNVTGATGVDIGDGSTNTSTILSADPTAPAALYTEELTSEEVEDNTDLLSSDEWRIPSETEWAALETLIQDKIDNEEIPEQTIVKALQETGELFWDDGNYLNNPLMFSTKGSGLRSATGLFSDKNEKTGYWTNEGKAVIIDNTADDISVVTASLTAGYSIRVIRDASSVESALEDGTIVSDYVGNDGTAYKAVKLGDYVWTVENLAETKTRAGADIDVITDTGDWAAATTGAMCSYDNDDSNNIEVLNPIDASDINLTIDEDVMEGEGTETSPLSFRDENDDVNYGVRNGKYHKICRNVDGGFASDIYLVTQKIDGGTA